jgi:hypothetical protein
MIREPLPPSHEMFLAPLPNLLVHMHGAVFSAWILLLMVQTSLVAGGRVALHRRLGLAGFALAILVFVLGLMTATDSLARHASLGARGAAVRAFYAIPLTDMLVFATLVYFAFRERSRPALHKRLILLATIMILDAAFVRWPVPATWWDIQAAQGCCGALVLALAGYDLWSTGRIHRATACAGASVIVLQQVRIPLGRTAAWQSFVAWVQNFTRSFH